MTPTEPRLARPFPLVPLSLALGTTFALILLVTAMPGSPSRPAWAAPPRAPGGGGGGGGLTGPLFGSCITSNNARLGDVLGLTVHARPQVGIWILASANTGPGTIGPFQTAVGPDWWILLDWTWTGGGDRVSLSLPVPTGPGFLGTEAVFQGVLHDPTAGEWALTEGVLHRASVAPSAGRSVLLVRQVSGIAQAPHAPFQGELLAASLRGRGHRVDVSDDFVPADLASYDVLLDARFTLPPAPGEMALLTNFLQHYGGVFFLCGPGLGSAGGQWRLQALQAWVTVDLGVGVVMGTGLNHANTTSESVSPGAHGGYLAHPNAVSGLPYEVRDEGGSFGPPGYATVGTPWIESPQASGRVYGLLLKAADLSGIPVRGSLAILFNGAPSALASSPTNPNADAILDNLVWWLDS